MGSCSFTTDGLSAYLSAGRKGVIEVDSFKGSNGNVVVQRDGWAGGDVTIMIRAGNERATGLSWVEARRLAYAIMAAADEHVDQKVKELEKDNAAVEQRP